MNILSAWIIQKCKTIARKSKVQIVDIVPDVEDDVKITRFSDGNSLRIHRRRGIDCTCRFKGNQSCQHQDKVYQKLKVRSHNVSGDECTEKVYTRLSYIMTKPPCSICLEDIMDKEVKLKELKLEKIWICDRCGTVMHPRCCQQWEQSQLGSRWDKKCFICRYPLAELKG